MAAAPLTALGDRTFGSLRRHRNYRLYFAGNGDLVHRHVDAADRGVLAVLELTDSPVAVGALALVQTLPVTVVALVGGSIADRVDLRRMVIACEAVLLAQAAVLCVLGADRARRRLAALRASGSSTGSPSRSTRPRGTRSSSRSSVRKTSPTRSGSARASARPRGSSAPPSAASSSRPSAQASRSASTR